MNFAVVGASMYGGNTVVYGHSFYFDTEESYNLARLIVPVKFS